ncbi:hypothetical protein AYO38_02050 [bacterium SCGC AG-212-C10]|nr:hypothetical protein AYO38_02050 [bacterium SCGC AG-212-C10]
MAFRTRLKQFLIRSGAHVSTGALIHLDSVVTHMELGRWFRDHQMDYRRAPQYARRNQLYSALAAPHAQANVLYLEFGVYQGASMRVWSKLLQNPASSLHGFDSFEGIPDAWGTAPAGTYTTQGVVPEFTDGRVVLHEGWFDATLPAFELPEHDQLIVNLDADIYSSTIFVLDTIADAITPGTILIFDEFNDRAHELKAFREFLDRHPEMQFRVAGVAWNGVMHCAFERER